jgi:hypothetical protein
MNRIYTGIGSRETPKDMLEVMQEIGFDLSRAGWILRSGRSPGADQAFEAGARLGPARRQSQLEIYIPWKGFEGATGSFEFIEPSYVCASYDEALGIAEQFHPAWDEYTEEAKKLLTRNVYQIVGKDLLTKTDFVVCWTKDGKRGGGTGQALRIAEYLEIPIFDLAIHTHKQVKMFISDGILP